MIIKNTIYRFALIGIIAVIVNACVAIQTSPVTGNKRAYGYTWEQEKQIGADSDKEIIAQYGLYDDPELAKYVNEIGQQLVGVSHLRREGAPSQYKNTEFTFRVLNSPIVNAFALPGGYVYITRGLLGHLNNEAQLAVVVGHEIGHVAARHASQRAAEQQLGQAAILGGAVLGQSLGLDGQNILDLSSQTAQLLFLQYSRDDERESDKLGVEYSAIDGYKSSEGAMFFASLKRISEKSGQSIPSHLSTHPDPGEREKTIPQLAEQWQEKGYPMTKVDADEFLSMIDGIMYGDNPREGYIENGIFYHPDLVFQFPVPEGFSLYNEPSSVIMVNSAQDAVMQFAIDTQNKTPQASVEAFTGQEGINTVNKGSYSPNGLAGFQAEATAKTEDGNTLTLNISAVTLNGQIYRFLSYTTTAQYGSYKEVFNSVPGNFKTVTDSNVLNVKPVTLKVVKASKTAPFKDLLPASLPMDITPIDVAIINQLDLDETVSKGTVIKIPVQ